MDRRTFLAAGTSLLFTPTALHAASQPRKSRSLNSLDRITRHVTRMARRLSRANYKPPTRLQGPLAEIGYDQYRDIRFKTDRAIWRDENLGFQIQLFASAYLYKEPVEINLVEGGRIQPLKATRDLFEWGALSEKIEPTAPISLSGFRIHAPIKTDAHFDELIAFQGASYFRGLGREHGYGLSARGLALNTTGPEDEEFPHFRAFWIERPGTPDLVTIHALLDSPSITGAYRFRISPGDATVLNTEVTLFPRNNIDNVGIAPLTSMFWFNTTNREVARDFRDSVHDSDGLAILNGAGENIWRPLLNPNHLQVSNFMDNNPRGFGLIQRARSFARYQDLEADYHTRPSAWIEPRGNWGQGSVELTEIPTQSEYFDNIVSYWRPTEPWKQGETYTYAYKQLWCDEPPGLPRFTVAATRIGQSAQPQRTQFAIDFRDALYGTLADQRIIAADQTLSATDAHPLTNPTDLHLEASAGVLTKPIVQSNPHTKGLRVSFELDPGDEQVIELRLLLRDNGHRTSEVWLYRWLAPQT